MSDTAAPPPVRPKGWRLFVRALQTRQSAPMFAVCVSPRLPFALLVGTLTAWLGEVGVKLATIGVLSWIGLTYAFKFLWSPLVDRLGLPGLQRVRRPRGRAVPCQVGLLP